MKTTKYITVKLTQDQQRFMIQLLNDKVINAPVEQQPNRVEFALRLRLKLQYHA